MLEIDNLTWMNGNITEKDYYDTLAFDEETLPIYFL